MISWFSHRIGEDGGGSISFTTTVKGLQLRAIFQLIWLSLELFKDPLQPVLTFDPGLTILKEAQRERDLASLPPLRYVV